MLWNWTWVIALWMGCTEPTIDGFVPSDTAGSGARVLVFSEPFDTLDDGRWNIADWTLGNTHFSESNVAISDGVLGLSHSPNGKAWHGAEIYSTDRFTYGQWTARIAAPTEKGTVCAFFFYEYSDDNGTWTTNEIDFEILDGRVMVGTYAQWQQAEGYENGPSRAYAWWDPPIGFDLAEFHDYTVLWSDSVVAFAVDEQVIAKTDIVPHAALSVRFNHWTSTTWSDVGTPPSDQTLLCQVDTVTAK